MRCYFSLTFILALLIPLAAGDAAEPAAPAGNRASDTPPDWQAKEADLKTRIAVLEGRVEDIHKGAQSMGNLVQIVAYAGIFFGAVLVAWQWIQQGRAQKFYEELMQREEKGKENLLGSVNENIGKASGLFGSLSAMLDIQTKAKELEDRDTARVAERRREIVQTLNADGIEICRKTTRGNYTLIERQEAIREFVQNLKWNQKEHRIGDDELGTACLLIQGLNLRLGDLKQRAKILEQATEFGIRDQKGNSLEEIRYDMSPELFREWSRECTREAFYQLGILRYNMGQYQPSINAFEKALEQDPADLGSALYVPEAKFLGHLTKDFDEIVAGFKAVANDIGNGPFTRDWKEEDKNAQLALTHVRWGNCYYAQSPHEPYRKHRSLKKAHDHFARATSLSPDSYLAQFSYAQSLSAWASQLPSGSTERKNKTAEAVKIFAGVFPKIRRKLATTSEPKIQCMLYYMLAICAKEGKIPGQLPEAYLTQIFNEKGRLGMDTELRIFSPRTKNDLKMDDFMREVEEYQAAS